VLEEQQSPKAVTHYQFDNRPLRVPDGYGLVMNMEPVPTSSPQSSAMNRKLIRSDEQEAAVRILSSDPPIAPTSPVRRLISCGQPSWIHPYRGYRLT
jgi:hypothetical protein